MDNLDVNEPVVELNSSINLENTDAAVYFDKISKNDFSVFYANIRSLVKNFDKLKDLLNICKFSPNIIALTETWLSGDKFKIVQLQNYNLLHVDRKDKIGGGVAFYVDKNIQYQIRSDIKLQ